MSVIARDEICRRLLSPDHEKQVFLPGSWSLECVRGAAYDLRVAADYLITPDGTRYWPGAIEGRGAREASFRLRPGEVAFVSSLERLCMPWDLAGNIAPKFRLALDGILVMGGLLVDPGYGREKAENGNWEPSSGGARLHFQLANIGTGELQVQPGETSVGALQLLRVDGDPTREVVEHGGASTERIRVPDSSGLLQDLFHVDAKDPLEPLKFFSTTANLRTQIVGLKQGIDKNELRLQENERSTDRLVVFGVFLIAITLFSVAIAAILGLISDANGGISGGGIVVGVLLVAIVGVVGWRTVLSATDVFSSLGRNRSAGA